jgi:hypothetical protein
VRAWTVDSFVTVAPASSHVVSAASSTVDALTKQAGCTAAADCVFVYSLVHASDDDDSARTGRARDGDGDAVVELASAVLYPTRLRDVALVDPHFAVVDVASVATSEPLPPTASSAVSFRITFKSAALAPLTWLQVAGDARIPAHGRFDRNAFLAHRGVNVVTFTINTFSNAGIDGDDEIDDADVGTGAVITADMVRRALTIMSLFSTLPA